MQDTNHLQCFSDLADVLVLFSLILRTLLHIAQNSRSMFRVILEIAEKSVVIQSQKRLPYFSKAQVSN